MPRPTAYAGIYEDRGFGFQIDGKESRAIADFDLAIADYTEAIRLDSGFEYYSGRADVYMKKGDYDRAIEDYSQAIVSDQFGGASNYLYLDRARAYFVKRKLERVLKITE